KGAGRGGQGAIQVGLRGVGQLSQHFVGGRIDDVLRLAALAAQEFAIDVKGKSLVHILLNLRGEEGLKSLSPAYSTPAGAPQRRTHGYPACRVFQTNLPPECQICLSAKSFCEMFVKVSSALALASSLKQGYASRVRAGNS